MTAEHLSQPSDRLPPSPLIQRLSSRLEMEGLVEQDILDMGCGTGRNSQYLSSLGHAVLGVSIEYDAVKIASYNDTGSRSAYIVSDVRNLALRKRFDVVIMNELLHMMPKNESKQVIKDCRSLTKPGGLNAISGYLVTDDIKRVAHQEQCFHQKELLQTYTNMGWHVIEYIEALKPVSYFRGEERVNSLTSIIARKPK